ncbi:transglycosylase domain-containing protein [Spirosoma sp. BT702]|uniref:Transglycosylase domain-containing protein n=1 Tax=Spirosoma profusum TaxID=2771354 RepID=A0A927ARA6_9BACT|nr:biosynthetic peptidoglycan transglycosylase [Spirosoma profusum]MBD2701966.1 transglycosylase domain-containing protein [Spirosoma profusum]
MTYRQQKALRIAGWVFLGIFLIACVGAGIAYSKREKLLQSTLERAIKKAKRDYKLDVRIGSARFTGLSSVAFTNISVVPEQRDSLARIGRVEVAVRFWPLLSGKIGLSGMTLENGLIQVIKRDTLTNIDFLLRRQRDSTQVEETPRENGRRADLSEVAENLIDNILSKIPDDLNVTNLEFRAMDSNDTLSLLTQTALIEDEAVTSTIKLNGNQATWHVAGTADPRSREYDLALYADGKPIEIPYIQKKYNLKVQADTLRAQLRDVDRSEGEFRLEGAGSVQNLRINHPAIARTDVLVKRAAMDANLFVGENYIGIDSSSTLYLGQISAKPFLKYTLSENNEPPQVKAVRNTSDKTPVSNKVYELQLHTGSMDAQALINSFPQGLFESLEGMQVAGKLKYDMSFQLDTALPDSVKFNSGMTSEGFKILRMGQTDFSSINRPFIYTPYEKGKPVRDIIVGPENPNYTPLEEISPDLRNALLTSEDYNFFTHKGFNEKAFRVSIATNFKEKSFKRGASTISMQLVKNVFLNRNKTLSRKVEEILIVWLIENEHIVPKSRMYEVYLNIIEWGRNKYGIGEAARYYFDKSPANLDLGESIFLAFVVPRPKRALDWFLPDGTLQTRNVRGYFRLIGRIMARRGLTAPDSGAYGFYNVRLREGLRQQVTPIDSIYQPDLLFPDPNTEEIDEDEGTGIGNFFRRLFKGKKSEEKPDNEQVTEPQQNNIPSNEPAPTDTVKTRKQLRQERREQKRREREAKAQQESSNN